MEDQRAVFSSIPSTPDQLAQQFEELSFHYLPRAKNQFVDALATLASMVDASPDMVIKPLNIQIHQQPTYCCNIQLVAGKPWFWDIQTWSEKEEYLEGGSKSDKRTLRELSKGYLYKDDILYKRTWNQEHLRCVTEREAQQIMEWVHGEEEGPHMNRMALAHKITN
ncbi:uncharacterized protein LOC110010766 [Jatropha curcas]|uniref:uncharacterized protein LOC110010766 n=1 Tax=Jatropha curcas TaxID=180498 RepID=UPI0009D689CE|nr:uncharacterized protein LOC110010766 [Jatropha curcas]